MNTKKQLLLAAGLAGSVVAGHQVASADQVSQHTVAAGETLSTVAAQYQTTVAQLAADNQIQNVDKIYQGQKLIIGVAKTVTDSQSTVTNGNANNTYRVQQGDNLWTLAQKFNTTVSQLVQQNNIQNANQIFVGQSLVVTGLNQGNGVMASLQVSSQTANPSQSETASQSQTAAVNHSVVASQAPTSQTVVSQSEVASQAPTSQTVVSQSEVANQASASQTAVSHSEAASQVPTSQTAVSQSETASQAPASQTAVSQSEVASQTPASQTVVSQSEAVSQALGSQAANNQGTEPVVTALTDQQSTADDYDQLENQALNTLIMKESGGNVQATNGIYFGIGQLSPTLRARYGGNSTDYQDQLQAMKAYIADRYGNAQAALVHHQEYGWY